MKRELRVAGLLTSPAFLATLALFCGLLVLLRTGRFPNSVALVPLFAILLLQQLTFRVVRVGAADTWRLLPGGFSTFMRALGLLVAGLALLVGALWSWSNGQLAFNSVPFGRFVFCFVFLSTIAVVMLATIRQRRGESFLVAGVIVSGLLVAALFQSIARPALWWTIALLFAAAWLYAGSGKLPAPAASRRAPEPSVRGWLVGFSPAARNLLQLDGRRLGRLLTAALVIVTAAVVQHQLHDHGGLIDNYVTSGLMPHWLALIFLFEMAVAMTSRARLLWLRTGNGRGGVFREVERVLLVNLAILGFIAWLVTTLLAAVRGISVQPVAAGLMLFCIGASALIPTYLALFAGTLQGWLSKAPVAVLGVVAVIVSPLLWSFALGLRAAGLGAPDPGALGWLTAAALLLRFLAAWRWRHLDWSTIRLAPHDQWMRRARTG